MKTAERSGRFQGVESVIRYGIVFLLAALACNAKMIGGLAGMGIALSAAMPKGYSYAAIAGRIANESKRRRIDGHSDDVTVVAVRITSGD